MENSKMYPRCNTCKHAHIMSLYPLTYRCLCGAIGYVDASTVHGSEKCFDAFELEEIPKEDTE